VGRDLGSAAGRAAATPGRERVNRCR
jgi:hypothetical protein